MGFDLMFKKGNTPVPNAMEPYENSWYYSSLQWLNNCHSDVIIATQKIFRKWRSSGKNYEAIAVSNNIMHTKPKHFLKIITLILPPGWLTSILDSVSNNLKRRPAATFAER